VASCHISRLLKTSAKEMPVYPDFQLFQQASSVLCALQNFQDPPKYFVEIDFWVTGRRMEGRGDEEAQIR